MGFNRERILFQSHYISNYERVPLQNKGADTRTRSSKIDNISLSLYLSIYFTGLCGPIAFSYFGGGVPIPEQRLKGH